MSRLVLLATILFGASSLLACDDGTSNPQGQYYGSTQASEAVTVQDYEPKLGGDPDPDAGRTPYSGFLARGHFNQAIRNKSRGVVVTLYVAKGPLGPRGWIHYSPENGPIVSVQRFDGEAADDGVYVMDTYDGILLERSQIEATLSAENADEPVEIHVSDAQCAGTIKRKLQARRCRARGETDCAVRFPAITPDCAPDLQ